MTDEGNAGKRSRHASQSGAAIDVCNAFERAWQAGTPPDIEPLLDRVPADDRQALLFGLLRRDISHRKVRGEDVSIEQYRIRFPNEAAMLAALFLQEDQFRALLQRCGYDLLERIESGRTGDVYRVVHREQERLFALKIIAAFLVRNDVIDAQQVVSLDYLIHDHIALPTELLEVDGNLLLFNEYVEGMNFGQLVEEFGAMPLGIACELACQVAEGLQQLHNHGKVHGALTPTTLVASTQLEELGTVKLGSVGLAEVADLTRSRFAQTQLQTEFDWRLFAAPELADQAGMIDPCCDLYSLGCTLRFLLSGQRPHGSQSSETKERIRVLWKRTELTDKPSDVPAALSALIDRMTAADPAERPSAAREVMEALQPFRDPPAYQQLLSKVEARVSRRQRLAGGVRVAGPEPDTPVSDTPQLAAQTAGARETQANRDDDAEQVGELLPKRWGRRLSALVMLAVICGAILLGLFHLFSDAGPDAEATLAEYTGDGGLSWFDEIPWFTPQLRVAMAREGAGLSSDRKAQIEAWIESASDVGAENSQTQRVLQSVVESLVAEMDGPEAIVTRDLLTQTRRQLTPRELRREYTRLAELLKSPSTATQFHLRALLRQACLDDERAAEDFQAALKLYRDEESCLLPLCACDYAQLAAESPRAVDDAVALLQRDALPHARTVQLRIAATCYQARLLRTQLGQTSRARETVGAASQIADEAGLASGHTLRCGILEEEAWIALDAWQLSEAESMFQQALRLREQHDPDSARRAWRYAADDLLGLAITAHLLGEHREAIELVSSLLAAIDASTNADAMLVVSPRRASELRALRPRLLTHVGDVYLTSADHDYSGAREAYQEAVDRSTESLQRPFVEMTIRYKLALVTALAGHVDEARTELVDAETALEHAYGEMLSNAATQLRDKIAVDRPVDDLRRYRTLALAAVELRSADSQRQMPGKTPILKSLESLACEPGRDPRSAQARLLAAQLLLESSWCEPARASRVVSNMAELMQHCTKDVEQPQRFFRRYARVAHFAGLAAQSALQDDGSEDRLGPTIAVLEKAHRVFRSKAKRGEATMPSNTSRLHSLAVGVSQYQFHTADQPLNLVSAHADAEDLDVAYRWLRREDGQGKVNAAGLYATSPLTRVLTNQDATRRAVLQFLEDLRALPAADLRKDLVVISLSGHGLQDLDGSLYFLPHDYQPGSLLSTGLNIDTFQSKLRMLGANVLLIIDTCYSGAARGAGGQKVLPRTTDEDVQRTLRRMAESETALAVLVAGKARQKAGESRLFGGHGALTAAVIEFLTQRQFDVETKDHARPVRLHANTDSRVLTLEDLRRYVVDRVAQFPMIDQRPSLYASGDRIGDYWCGDIPLRFVADRPLGKTVE